MRQKPSAANILSQHLDSPDRSPQKESRPWYDLAIEHHRRHQQFEADREAKREANEAAAVSTPDLIRSTLASQSTPSSTMPLNGTRVLTAGPSD